MVFGVVCCQRCHAEQSVKCVSNACAKRARFDLGWRRTHTDPAAVALLDQVDEIALMDVNFVPTIVNQLDVIQVLCSMSLAVERMLTSSA